MTRIFTRLALATLATTCSTAALAQATTEPGTGATASATPNDEIVVTAQKREQRIADVPVTVTAITGAKMASIGVNSLSEVAAYIPGLQIQEQSANNPGFVIRGITSDNGSSQQGARVTLYYNGIDISRSRGAYQDLFDLERIEVVKGPQATLFGTAAAVGAISVISAKPQPGTSGAINGSYGNFNRTQVSGFLNAGNDVLAGRIAFAYKYRDGYVRNIAGDPKVPNQNQGGVDQDDLNGQDQRGLRGSLRYRPSDSVTADLVLTYDGQRNPGTAFKSRAHAPTGGQTGDYGYAELSGSPYSAAVLGARKLGLDRNVYDANLTITADLSPGITFTTVNGYRRFDALEVFDADGGPAAYLEFAEDAKGDQWSHESRFAFEGPKYRASVGWNAFFENGYQRVPFATEEGTYLACSVAAAYAPIRTALNGAGIATGTSCVAPNGTIPATRATAALTGGRATAIPYAAEFTNYGRNNTYSVFADATYIPVPALELTAGARILIEDRQSGYSSVQPNSVILAALGIRTSLLGTANTNGNKFVAEKSFTAILPRFNALLKLNDDVNLYATISKGRRSPVVQLAAQNTAFGVGPNLQVVPQENVWNYEGGIKGRVGPFTGAASVFYQTYDGFQVSITNNGVTTTQSAGSAKNLGVELEGNLQLASYLSAFATFSYIDGGIGDEAANGVFAGNRFRLQPETTASGGLMLRLPVGGATLYATPSINYRTKVFFELPNSQAVSTPGYTLVNARAGLEFAQGRYSVGGFVRNATNKRYLIDAGNTGGGFGIPTYIAGEPRFYGIELGAKF
ncbi:outer membrane receptor protein involved in Fe transport [Sphingomonas sp. PP-F2F-G114-C0414]|uniref:TonB-dependent receptor domain-containing protein n=1 Tax=Sphingomonas sp. PP-F2F-G114-C0414 TaxID=2135662 RepID=UPI000EF8E72A|nr:TonB-dependent receptor [Sphingomonas sp. PP-F2F-G114-C0414]RMB35906.1 outer membrane receptor protein involved in Fe transport [Sphingomonas sp. PP-F2F-G114-C0414]